MFDKFILNFLRRGEGERRGWNGTWDLKMAEEFEVRGNGAFDADTIYDLLKGWSFFFFILLFFPSFTLSLATLSLRSRNCYECMLMSIWCVMICDRMNLLFIFYVQFIHSNLFILMVSLFFFFIKFEEFRKKWNWSWNEIRTKCLTLRLIIIYH